MAEAFIIQGPTGPISVLDQPPQKEQGGHLPILLIHGINMSKDVWQEVSELLCTERRVVSFDLRGHGQSGAAGEFAAQDYAQDALAVLDALGIECAHAVGTSFGGSVANALAVEAPGRVKSVAAFGSALASNADDVEAVMEYLRAVGVQDFFTAFIPEASFAPGTDAILVNRAIEAAVTGREVETVVAVTAAAIKADTTALAEAVSVPALVVTGELDLTCPVAAGEALASALGCELVVLPGYGHMLPMETPAEVADLIKQHSQASD